MELQESPLSSPTASPASQGELDNSVVLPMVLQCSPGITSTRPDPRFPRLKPDKWGDMNVDIEKIRSVCDGLFRDYQIRDEAIGNLTRLVKETLDRPASHHPHRDAVAPHPIIQQDLIDADGNLHAADIGITWQGSETFLHGVRVVGPHAAGPPPRSQPATSTPYVPVREHVSCHMSTPPPIQPSCVEVTDRPVHRVTQESRQSYRPAAPIQGSCRCSWLG